MSSPTSLGSHTTERNLTWTQTRVSREDRWRLMGQSGVVVWLTGLSGSGKSTLAVTLESWLHHHGRHCQVLDGDNVRQGLCRGLSFSEEDRMENIRRTAEAAKLLAEAGVITICSLVSPFIEQRQEARRRCESSGVAFLEVFVNAPLSVCEQRDPRGLYRKARAGEIQQFTGIASPYEGPVNPDLELRTDLKTLDACMEELSALVMSAAQLKQESLTNQR